MACIDCIYFEEKIGYCNLHYTSCKKDNYCIDETFEDDLK